jgi:hypothetical protein
VCALFLHIPKPVMPEAEAVAAPAE